MKRGVFDNVMYDIHSYPFGNSFERNPNVAIEVQGVVYPPMTKSHSNVGYYPLGNWGVKVNQPVTNDEIANYSSDKVIDLSQASNMKELIQSTQRLKNMEKESLVCIGDPTQYPISEKDSIEMRGLKQAINKKGIDINQYGNRFGSLFPNDKRLLNKHEITITKMKKFITNLDMKACIIIEDRSPDVPNPIGERIVINLVDGESE